MQDWLADQIRSITADWATSIERHYPQYAPMWKDADLCVAKMKSAFFPALSCLDFPTMLPRNNSIVLDYGSGSGWLSAELSKYKQVGRIDALDADEFNLRTLMPAVITRLGGVPEKVRPVLGLFEPVLVLDDTYDLIVASSSIHHSNNL